MGGTESSPWLLKGNASGSEMSLSFLASAINSQQGLMTGEESPDTKALIATAEARFIKAVLTALDPFFAEI